MKQKTYHFISGLPRAGSTLLTSILNQNPEFYSSISDPLLSFMWSILVNSHSEPEMSLMCPESKRIELMSNILETYYSHVDKRVCFNTNRSWTEFVQHLDKMSPDSKIICCVRDINQILNSFETLFKNNPFSLANIYGKEVSTVYSRTEQLMHYNYIVGHPYSCLKEVLAGNHRHKILLVEYEDLAKYPETAMRTIYEFIGETYYDHDFSNVEMEFSEYDTAAGVKGLHSIRKEVSYKPEKMILPPDILNQYRNYEVWRKYKTE